MINVNIDLKIMTTFNFSVHCDTKEKAKIIIDAYHEAGAKWYTSNPHTLNWRHEENTMYAIEHIGEQYFIKYGDITNNAMDRTIIEFEDFIKRFEIDEPEPEPENSEPLQIDRMKLLKDLL